MSLWVIHVVSSQLVDEAEFSDQLSESSGYKVSLQTPWAAYSTGELLRWSYTGEVEVDEADDILIARSRIAGHFAVVSVASAL
jgi:hypothetical protein